MIQQLKRVRSVFCNFLGKGKRWVDILTKYSTVEYDSADQFPSLEYFDLGKIWRETNNYLGTLEITSK